MDPSKIVTITLPDEELFLIKENDRWVPLKERYLSKVIPHFTDLMEKARKKYFSKWLEKCQIIRKAKSDRSLPNAHQKLWLGAKKAPPTKELLIQGAEAFLALSRLSEDKKLCYQIICVCRTDSEDSLCCSTVELESNVLPSELAEVALSWLC